MSITNEERCLEVEENLAEVLEGLAPTRLMDHLGDCDRCRDLKYEAERALELAGHAGADFRMPDGFAERVLAAVLEARPNGPEAHGADSVVPRTSGVVDTPRATAPSEQRPAAQSVADVARTAIASAPTEFADTTDNNKTVFEPKPPVEPPVEVEPAAPADVEPGTKRAASAPAVIKDPFVPTNKTVPLSAVADRRAARSLGGQDSAAQAGDASEPVRAVEAVTGRQDTGSKPQSASGSLHTTSPSAGVARSAVGQPSVARGAAEAGRGVSAKPSAGSQPGEVVSLFKKRGFIAALVGSMAAAAAIGAFVIHQNPDQQPETAKIDGGWTGTVGSIARAGDGDGGLEVCNDGRCKVAAQGAAFEQGSTLKTDSKTRARVKLGDGSWLAIDRSSEVELPAGDVRQAKIERGLVVANIENIEGAKPAKLILPQGEVTVLGTKLAATVTDRRASLEVVRGEIDVTSRAGGTAKVRAGEEATIEGSGEPIVAASSTLSDVLEWSSESADDVDAPTLRGIGELKARKPGSLDEKAKAVRLSKHSVKVRVVDVVARTEVDETFTNDTDDELEGIFRFPMPPGAQIERLALEVDGKLIEGAFVDRDRGAAIWRGVIQNAAPKAPRPREEIVWVPGPWRDPALLEWQRGGRFELKIFPIPKRGSRRVVLTYTQVVPQSGGVRRFTYPLAHDASGSTKIDAFDLDVQVLGHDKQFGVETRGYELAKSDGGAGADKLALSEKSFVPAGDLTLEYALPNRGSGLTTWAYAMPPEAATLQAPSTGLTGGASGAGNTLATPTLGAGRLAPAQRAQPAEAEAKALTTDGASFVAMAIRPKLPRFPEGKERLHVIVVDSSRSMVGESFARATHLAAGIVREMDRRDNFMVLACDVTCQAMGATEGRTLPGPTAPSAEAAQQVETFLGSIEPDGGSNLVAAVQAARAAANLGGGRELRVLYLGDGTPTVGATKPATLEAAVRHVLPSGDGAVVAVALGSDADATTLSALARGAGGVMVPYVPGQRVSAAAVDVLAAAYGSVLSDVEVTLPPGLQEITPRRVDPVSAGGETFVFARMSGKAVDGNVTIRGRVGNEKFEQTWPAKVLTSSAAGNAFVPRLFAAAKIAELEALGSADDRERVVALSKRFQVASRQTSLLVLESEAMFKAFGLDKNGVTSAFTGETAAESSSAEPDAEEDESSPEDAGKNKKEASRDRRENGFAGDDLDLGLSGIGSGPGGGGRASGSSGGFAPAPEPAAAAEKSQSAPRPKPAATTTAAPASPPRKAPTDDPFSPGWNENRRPPPPPIVSRPPSRPPQNLVPMRRVFDRKATFSNGSTLATEVATALAEAESGHRSSPDSRDKTIALYKALFAAGRIGEAQELTAKWSQRDALDQDALLARADLAAANGDRSRALRILSGLSDVRPGDKSVQKRLVSTFTQMGAPDLACNHRLALAEIDSRDVNTVAAAFRCTQDQGFPGVATALLGSAPGELRERIETTSRTLKLNDPANLLGDVRMTATWNAPVDLDIALIDKSGRRFSWLGSVASAIGVSATNAASTTTETLAVSGLSNGNFTIEIVRAATDRSTVPVTGELTLTLPGGESRKVPFTLQGSRVEAGSLRVFFTSRLVPVNGGFGGGGGWRGNSTF